MSVRQNDEQHTLRPARLGKIRYRFLLIPGLILALAIVTVILITQGEHEAPFVYSIR